MVDVRDVALAHLRAIECEEAKNNRFLVSSEVVWFTKLSDYVKREFAPSYTIPQGDLAFWKIKLAALLTGGVAGEIVN